MQEYTNEESKSEKVEQLKKWLQENLRIIVSIAIVALIAGGIYSYSKRAESPATQEDQVATEQQASGENGSVEVANKDEKAQQKEGVKQTVKVSPEASGQETEAAFVETAGKGDGSTILARRALASYLEKNADSALTKEHKIYIEDYLRKHVSTKHVKVGASIEFSKDLIGQAVTASKNLNDRQLKNLQKYSARVTNI